MSLRRGLLAGALCLALILAVCPPRAYGGSINLLDGAWFKLKLTVKGYKFVPDTGEYEKYNFSAPAYLHLLWDGAQVWYSVDLWTFRDGVWQVYPSGSTRTLRPGEHFLESHLILRFMLDGSDNIFTAHAPFISIQKDAGGLLQKAAWQGTGNVLLGFFEGGTKQYFGYFNLTGQTVDPSKLPEGIPH